MSTKTARVLVFMLVTAPLAVWAATSDIDKFGWVSDSVATGGQPTVPQIASLKHEGFRTIINLRQPSEHDAAAEVAAAKQQGLGYINIPVATADPKPEQVDAFLKATADRHIFPLFIHCGSGNRVGAFWMIRRVLVDRWSVEDAEVQAKLIGLRSPSLRDFAIAYIRDHQGISGDRKGPS